MKNHLLCFFTIILSINCYSQISFEKGYYIDNNNQTTECLIKNVDWQNNPTGFEYKLTENAESKEAKIESVNEFGINNISKYVRHTVNIDRSSNILNNLSDEKEPIFKQEMLFLKVLIEGKANLYEYVDVGLKRYFYSTDTSNVEQLIFKSYKTDKIHVGQNNRFRQQLWTDLKCPNFKMSKIENIDYKKNDLVRFFTEYSECHNNALIHLEPKQKRDLFNLTLRPRLNLSSLAIQNTVYTRHTEFENQSGFGFGLEAEFILPFNKNKWAIAIEPTYQSYESNGSANFDNLSGGKLVAEVEYSSIELPISLRHYLFLNNNSKIFLNASFVFDFSSKSSILLKRADNSIIDDLDVKSRNNAALGIGYKLYDKYSLEMRYQTSREILSEYPSWNTDYKTFSIIVGYSLF